MTPDEQQPSQEPQLTDEEMRAALEEELKRVRVEQVVTEATVSILNVAVLRAGLVPGSEGEVDPAQVRMGIEAVRALLPQVEPMLGPDARQIRDAVSRLQMEYARLAGAGGPEGPEGQPAPQGAGEGEAAPEGTQQPPEPEGPGPAQSSGRLWVPGR